MICKLQVVVSCFLFVPRSIPAKMVQFDGRLFFKWVETWNHQPTVSYYVETILPGCRILVSCLYNVSLMVCSFNDYIDIYLVVTVLSWGAGHNRWIFWTDNGHHCDFSIKSVGMMLKKNIVVIIFIMLTRWWFQIFFIFTPTWGRFPFWLIFF